MDESKTQNGVVNDLPEDIQRWTAKRRAALVLGILRGETSVQEAARKHDLTVAEIEEWKDRYLLAAKNPLRSRPKDEEALKDEQIKKLERKVGLAGIEVLSQEPNEIHLMLFDESRQVIALMEIVRSQAKGVDLTIRDTEKEVTIGWDPGRGLFSIRERDGDLAVMEFSDPTRRWTLASGRSDLLSTNKRGVALAFTALGDLEEAGLAPSRRDHPTPEQDSRALSTEAPSVVGCVPGDWVSGACWGTRRSLCCRCATIEANEMCNNMYCWGCCEVLPCDATCITGDFGCICTVAGQLCNPNTWP